MKLLGLYITTVKKHQQELDDLCRGYLNDMELAVKNTEITATEEARSRQRQINSKITSKLLAENYELKEKNQELQSRLGHR